MKLISRAGLSGTLVLVCLAVSRQVCAQGFNVDFDISIKDPRVGGGVPSPSFGAAADQVGFWNSSHFGPEPRTLRDLQGNLTDVIMTAETTTGSFSGLGFFNPINTGDYALLLNDAARVAFVNQTGTLRYTLSNMMPGTYAVYTYAVRPQGEHVEVPITISTAVTNQTQVVTGPMPGNSFEYLVTHSEHLVDVSTGTFSIEITQPLGVQRVYYVNGFQVVPVPETNSVISVGVAGLYVLLRRQRCRKYSQ